MFNHMRVRILGPDHTSSVFMCWGVIGFISVVKMWFNANACVPEIYHYIAVLITVFRNTDCSTQHHQDANINWQCDYSTGYLINGWWNNSFLFRCNWEIKSSFWSIRWAICDAIENFSFMRGFILIYFSIETTVMQYENGNLKPRGKNPNNMLYHVLMMISVYSQHKLFRYSLWCSLQTKYIFMWPIVVPTLPDPWVCFTHTSVLWYCVISLRLCL